MTKVYFRGPKAKAREIAYRLAKILSGKESDPIGIARGVFLSMGLSALSSVQGNFIDKSHGGSGDDGQAWEPLRPKTIAGRRLGPGDKAQPHIKARLDAEKEATKQSRKRFTEYAKKRRKQLTERYALSMSKAEAKRRASAEVAAERARADFKQRGKLAVTRETREARWQVMSRRKVDILRDTGVLINSLSPGQLSGLGPGATYSPPSKTGGEEQEFETISDGVIVGTNVPYAITHQEGDPAKHVPARPFLPDGDVPEIWEERWIKAGLLAMEVGLRMLYEYESGRDTDYRQSL